MTESEYKQFMRLAGMVFMASAAVVLLAAIYVASGEVAILFGGGLALLIFAIMLGAMSRK